MTSIILAMILLPMTAAAIWAYFEIAKIKGLESTIDNYRERNKQLEQFESKCAELELKVKCMDMYINDDEAILELISASKARLDDNLYRQQSAMQNITGMGSVGIGRGYAYGSQSSLVKGLFGGVL